MIIQRFAGVARLIFSCYSLLFIKHSAIELFTLHNHTQKVFVLAQFLTSPKIKTLQKISRILSVLWCSNLYQVTSSKVTRLWIWFSKTNARNYTSLQAKIWIKTQALILPNNHLVMNHKKLKSRALIELFKKIIQLSRMEIWLQLKTKMIKFRWSNKNLILMTKSR